MTETGLPSAPAEARPIPAKGPTLTVVVPTRNERENVAVLIDRLVVALDGVAWEVIFVDDDSPDGTADVLREIAQRDTRVRVIQRIGRRGLSSACVEGIMSSSAPFVAVMDGDLQHDETLLPKMLDAAMSEDLEVVIGSRFVDGGSVGDWESSRQGISRFATRLAHVVLKTELTDPMSGFFLVRRTTFNEIVERLSGRGFKILLDIFASAPRPLRYKELPFRFGVRMAGESKLDSLAVLEYLHLLAEKSIGRFIPIRFLLFSAVGSIGVVVHFSVLATALYVVSFPVAQSAATLVAMIGNFTLNNVITYRDVRLRGWAWLRGLLIFILICSLGAAANVGVASLLFFSQDTSWWLSGLAGTAVGTVWNYAMASAFAWTKKG